MRRKNNENKVSDVIELMLNQYGLSAQYREFRLLQSWSELMGPMIANRTEDIYIRNKILFIKLKSAALRNELMYEKARLVNRLNEAAGEAVIEEIVFQ
jgi:predicted nucleic acid-binding Zn ribbon protein